MSPAVISPELALVDPELAAAARVLLPVPGSFGLRASPLPPIARPTQSGRRLSPALVVAGCALAVAFVLSPSKPSGNPTQGLAQRATEYTWPAVPGARGYRVALVRDGRLAYEATSPTSSMALPASLRLAPGRYTWSATPISETGAPARPVVEETFQVDGGPR